VQRFCSVIDDFGFAVGLLTLSATPYGFTIHPEILRDEMRDLTSAISAGWPAEFVPIEAARGNGELMELIGQLYDVKAALVRASLQSRATVQNKLFNLGTGKQLEIFLEIAELLIPLWEGEELMDWRIGRNGDAMLLSALFDGDEPVELRLALWKCCLAWNTQRVSSGELNMALGRLFQGSVHDSLGEFCRFFGFKVIPQPS